MFFPHFYWISYTLQFWPLSMCPRLGRSAPIQSLWYAWCWRGLMLDTVEVLCMWQIHANAGFQTIEVGWLWRGLCYLFAAMHIAHSASRDLSKRILSWGHNSSQGHMRARLHKYRVMWRLQRPHMLWNRSFPKESIKKYMDELTESARIIGAVNTAVFPALEHHSFRWNRIVREAQRDWTATGYIPRWQRRTRSFSETTLLAPYGNLKCCEMSYIDLIW